MSRADAHGLAELHHAVLGSVARVPPPTHGSGTVGRRLGWMRSIGPGAVFRRRWIHGLTHQSFIYLIQPISGFVTKG